MAMCRCAVCSTAAFQSTSSKKDHNMANMLFIDRFSGNLSAECREIIMGLEYSVGGRPCKSCRWFLD